MILTPSPQSVMGPVMVLVVSRTIPSDCAIVVSGSPCPTICSNRCIKPADDGEFGDVPSDAICARIALLVDLHTRILHTLLHSDDWPWNTYCRNWRTPCGTGFELEKRYLISTQYEKDETSCDPVKPLVPSSAGPPQFSEVSYAPVFHSGTRGTGCSTQVLRGLNPNLP